MKASAGAATPGIDPLVLYKKEAYDMFQQMQASIQEEVVRVMSFIQISMEAQMPRRTRWRT